jgi:hypothetical protein
METPKSPRQATSYQLLIASEEKGRTALESAVYLLLIVATSVSIWQVSHQPVTIPRFGNETPIAQQGAALPG